MRLDRNLALPGLDAEDNVSKPGDRHTDRDKGEPIEVRVPKTPFRVDRMPGVRDSHATEQVLVSIEGTRILPGGWQPVLNGNELFGDGRQAIAGFPIKLSIESYCSNRPARRFAMRANQYPVVEQTIVGSVANLC